MVGDGEMGEGVVEEVTDGEKGEGVTARVAVEEGVLEAVMVEEGVTDATELGEIGEAVALGLEGVTEGDGVLVEEPMGHQTAMLVGFSNVPNAKSAMPPKYVAVPVTWALQVRDAKEDG